jgi:lipopolysaccharide transport system ATP-binding protein
LARGRQKVRRTTTRNFWALRGVSFALAPGDVLGVIGRNGAGKSTLLKILSRITEPTEGRVELRGRVASLLEVGTGFHPELTGRENTYLNGAILGMSRREIRAKLDEIVAFADVERFLDTPVKRYSSGMYVRLAFAIAAHLDAEILMVDEVLAVGDAEFQQKCMGKMRDVTRSGRTVVFVSHNMASIEALCDRCILLKEGRIIAEGLPREVLATYTATMLHASSGRVDLTDHRGRRKEDSDHSMISVALASGTREPISMVRVGETLEIKVEFACRKPISPVLGVVIANSHGVPILSFDNFFIGGYQFARASRGTISCVIDELPLMPGRYLIDLWLNDGERSVDMIHEAIAVEVESGDVFGTGRLPPPGSGQVVFPASFRFQEAASTLVRTRRTGSSALG